MTKVCCTSAITTHKINLPVNLMEESEATLHCMSEFDSFVNRCSLSGPDQFKYFREVISGTARGSWDLAAEKYSDNTKKSPENFEKALDKFPLSFFTEKSHEHLVDCLDQVKKPRNMTELELATRLRQIRIHATFSPPPLDPQKELTDLRMKTICHHMQPETFQTQFAVSGKKLHKKRMTLRKMADFFGELETSPQFNSNAGSSTSRRNGDNDRNNGGRRNTGGSRSCRRGGSCNDGNGGRHKRRGDDDDRRSNKRQDGRQDPNSDCRLHSHLRDKNHKWKDCVCDPSSEACQKRHAQHVSRQATSQQNGCGNQGGSCHVGQVGPSTGGQHAANYPCSQGAPATGPCNGQTHASHQQPNYPPSQNTQSQHPNGDGRAQH